MDREGADVDRTMTQMHRLLSGDCVLMTGAETDALREELAARDEALLERHFEGDASREEYLAGARPRICGGQSVSRAGGKRAAG